MVTIRDTMPKLRVRMTDVDWGYEYLPQSILTTTYASGATTSKLGTQYTVVNGVKKSITDYKPVLWPNPPRMSNCTISSLRASSTLGHWKTNSRLYYVGKEWKGKLASNLFPDTLFWNESDISIPLTFDMGIAQNVHQMALAKLNDPDIAANEYLFEYMQVLRLLKDPVRTCLGLGKTLQKWFHHDMWIYTPGQQGVGQTFITMRTRKRLSLQRASKDLVIEASNRWLQYRYGIMPLYLDVLTVLGKLKNGEIPNINQIQYHSCKARQVMQKTVTDRVLTRSLSPFVVRYREKSTKMDVYSAKVIYQKRGEPSLSWKAGIHPHQMATAIYNAIPYSFVLDWAVNVDQCLKSLSVNPYVSIRGNCVTRKLTLRTELHRQSVQDLDYPNEPVQIKLDSVGSFVCDKMRRECNLETPRGIYFSVKWQKAKNLMTALALIVAPVLNRGKRK